MLAEQIRTEYGLAIRHAEDALSHARITGELLMMARNAVPTGEWQAWVARECPDISARTVRRYIQLAREWPRVATATTVRAALAALAPPRSEPRGPIDADEILQAAEACGCESIPPELRISVEPGYITAGLIDGEPAVVIAESQRHRGYWHVLDMTDRSYFARPILGAAVGLLVGQITDWDRCEWHMAAQHDWFPEADVRP